MSTLLPRSSFPDLRLASVSTHDGRHLPRWEASGAVYHIALHLADSIPAEERRIWLNARTELQARLKQENRQPTEFERDELRSVYNERVERYLAAGYGECLLRNPEVQRIIHEVLEYGDGKDYALHLWCLMPNHLHIIAGSFATLAALTKALTTWKRISGHRINSLLKREGPVWQADGYTRIIRNEDEYRAQLSYVWHNPESAGLTDGFAREAYVKA